MVPEGAGGSGNAAAPNPPHAAPVGESGKKDNKVETTEAKGTTYPSSRPLLEDPRFRDRLSRVEIELEASEGREWASLMAFAPGGADAREGGFDVFVSEPLKVGVALDLAAGRKYGADAPTARAWGPAWARPAKHHWRWTRWSWSWSWSFQK